MMKIKFLFYACIFHIQCRSKIWMQLKKSLFYQTIFSDLFINILNDKCRKMIYFHEICELKQIHSPSKHFLMTFFFFNCIQIFGGQNLYIYSCLVGSKLNLFWKIPVFLWCFNPNGVLRSFFQKAI